MSRQITFLPQVSNDLVEGSNYYETLSPGRGAARFEADFRQAIQQVKAGVVTHAVAFGSFHRVLLRRFPYTIYYRLVDDRAVIAALLYARFDPGRIESILSERGKQS
jgi:hypothetical protein